MQAIIAMLAQLGLRLLATGIAERVLLGLARELAKRTDSPMDDDIVDAIAKTLGTALPPSQP